jgi:hypothetical protein
MKQDYNTLDIDALIARERRKEAKANAEIDLAIRKAVSGVTARLVRAFIYALVTYLLIFRQDILEIGSGLAFIVFLLALPRRSAILAEITLGILLFLALLPNAWEKRLLEASF